MIGRPKNSKNKDYRNAVYKCLLEAEGALWVNEISRRTGIPAKTVTNILDEFWSHNLIIDHGFSRDTGGKVRFRLVRLKTLEEREK